MMWSELKSAELSITFYMRHCHSEKHMLW